MVAARTEALLLARHADHHARHLADEDRLADRILSAAEQRRFRVLVDDDFLRQFALGARVEEAARLELDALDREVLGADAVHLRARLDRRVAQRARGRDGRRRAGGVILARQRLGVGEHERLDLGRPRVAEAFAGKDLERVGAEIRDVVEHLAARALAERHHGDDRGDADDDAEHGQKGAQAMRGQGEHGHAERLGESVDRRAPRRFATGARERATSRRPARPTRRRDRRRSDRRTSRRRGARASPPRNRG